MPPMGSAGGTCSNVLLVPPGSVRVRVPPLSKASICEPAMLDPGCITNSSQSSILVDDGAGWLVNLIGGTGVGEGLRVDVGGATVGEGVGGSGVAVGRIDVLVALGGAGVPDGGGSVFVGGTGDSTAGNGVSVGGANVASVLSHAFKSSTSNTSMKTIITLGRLIVVSPYTSEEN